MQRMLSLNFSFVNVAFSILLERYYQHYCIVSRQSFHPLKLQTELPFAVSTQRARPKYFCENRDIIPPFPVPSASPLFPVNGERKHRRGFSDGRRREALTRILRDRSLSSILQHASHRHILRLVLVMDDFRVRDLSTWTLVPHTADCVLSGSKYNLWYVLENERRRERKRKGDLWYLSTTSHNLKRSLCSISSDDVVNVSFFIFPSCFLFFSFFLLWYSIAKGYMLCLLSIKASGGS